MSPPVTTHTGPLGSTLHVLRADAGTVAALAAVDWNRHFSLVGLDPVRGLITLMSASHRHGLWSVMLDDVVDIAGSTLTGASRGLRHSRLRGPGEPCGTGVEPDGSYYLGERVGGYIAALTEGDKAADAFFERTPPDLAYEVELMDADGGKVERYAELGVRELWLLHARKGTGKFRVEFLSLRPGCAPRKLDASEVLEGFTPEDVYEAEAGSAALHESRRPNGSGQQHCTTARGRQRTRARVGGGVRQGDRVPEGPAARSAGRHRRHRRVGRRLECGRPVGTWQRQAAALSRPGLPPA